MGALLAYLALESRQPHSRQTLAELLWSHRSKVESLNSLRFALANLRSALQDQSSTRPFLLVDRYQIQLNPQADVWVDALAFQQQAAACEAQVGHAPPLSTLRSTLDLYHGSFLQNFDLGDSLPFETWALSQREHIDRQRLRLLRLLAVDLESGGNAAQAEEIYRSILAVQPWDEAIHRCLMRLLAASGQRGAALAQYDACRQSLLDELGVQPERETHRLYHQIKREIVEAAAAPALPSPDDPPPTPFVARERELAKLDAALARGLSGLGQVVWIAGEAGTGKTALLREFSRQALDNHPDLLVVGGQCNAYTGLGQPYLPFIESLQLLAGEWDDLPWAGYLAPEHRTRLQAALPWVAQALVELAPALLDRFVGCAALACRLPDPAGAPCPDWRAALSRRAAALQAVPLSLEAGVLFEQITRLLAAVARRSPLILILDDLQWIDTASAALLFHLVRRLANNCILILIAYRPGEVYDPHAVPHHPLQGVLTELQRQFGSSGINLDQVDEQAFVAAFLEKDPLLHPHHLDPAFCATLAHRTGGNPLFTIELLRSLQSRGDLHRAADGAWVSSPDLTWDHLPERVEAVIAGRLARLPAQWLDWLSTASVEGESFTLEVLARVHGLDEALILQNLSGPHGLLRGAARLLQAEGVHWLNEGSPHTSRALSRYRFRHILFQTYLYQRLDPVERARRHASVGFALDQIYAGPPDPRAPHAAAIARHFEAGRLPLRAAAYLLEAGRYALRLASDPVAIAHYQHGLDLLKLQPPTPERDRLKIGLYLALGAPFLSGNWGGAERQAAIQNALDLIRATGQGAGWPELLPALYSQADWLIGQNQLASAVALGEQMLALAPGRGDLIAALAHRTLGFAYLFQGKYLPARAHLESALALSLSADPSEAIALSGSDLECFCRGFLGAVLTLSGYADQGWAQVSQALRRARALQYWLPLGGALVAASEVAMLRRDPLASKTLAAELLTLGQAPEMRIFLAYGMALEGYAQLLQSEPDSPAALMGFDATHTAFQTWERSGTRSGWGAWTVRLAFASLHAGRIETGLQGIAVALTGDKSVAGYLAEIYRLQGELLLKQSPSNRTAATACFQRALAIAREQSARTFELRIATSLARLWQFEDPQSASQLLSTTCAHFTEGHQTPDWQEAQSLLNHLLPS
jgi:DNA-binding SARP family transcriptional activator